MGELWWLFPSVVVVAALYSSVGHGGASGYLAVLTLTPGALAPAEMATTALTLNVIVAGMGSIVFARAGHFSGRLVLPFVAASLPAAFLGGRMHVSVDVYEALLAISLTAAAARLLLPLDIAGGEVVKPPALTVALPAGGAIGWLSGVVGVGGGIFLSPLILLRKWATPKKTAACAAFFIVVNSVAGLAGRLAGGEIEYGGLWPLVAAAFIGGWLGSRLGARRFSGISLNRLLALVLLFATLKLIITL